MIHSFSSNSFSILFSSALISLSKLSISLIIFYALIGLTWFVFDGPFVLDVNVVSVLVMFSNMFLPGYPL